MVLQAIVTGVGTIIIAVITGIVIFKRQKNFENDLATQLETLKVQLSSEAQKEHLRFSISHAKTVEIVTELDRQLHLTMKEVVLYGATMKRKNSREAQLQRFWQFEEYFRSYSSHFALHERQLPEGFDTHHTKHIRTWAKLMRLTFHGPDSPELNTALEEFLATGREMQQEFRKILSS